MSNIEERGDAAVVWQKGPRHTYYEDRYRLLCPPIPTVVKTQRGSIFAVADGVGGAPRGMAAAQEVCSCLDVFFTDGREVSPSVEFLASLLYAANARIQAWGMIEGTDRPQGACAASIVWIEQDSHAHIFHSGDTSVLLIRDGTAQILTKIHQSPEGHLLRYFGHDVSPVFDTTSIALEESDRLILFSDGLSKVMFNQQIVDIVEQKPTRQASLSALLQSARSLGSGDDITAILVDV